MLNVLNSLILFLDTFEKIEFSKTHFVFRTVLDPWYLNDSGKV